MFPRCLLAAALMVLSVSASMAEPRISPQAPAPDWSLLEAYQRTMTEDEFVKVVDQVYAPGKAFWKYARRKDGKLYLYSDTSKKNLIFTLEFAPEAKDESPLPVSFFPEGARAEAVKAVQAKAAETLPVVPPLLGVKVCLDPGHLGGEWAELERRHFQVDDDNPVVEGELTLITALHTAAMLRQLGASVLITRQDLTPVTTKRPSGMLEDAAEAMSIWRRRKYTVPSTEAGRKKFQEIADKLFYIHSEIRAREILVEQFQPDLTLCIHYNASDWGRPGEPRMTPLSRLVVFVNGCYSAGELSYDDQKFELMLDVLDRVYPMELAAADQMARQLARTFDLAPEEYKGWSAVKRVGPNPYVYARNLLANRVFPGPVAFVEGPYMNAQDYYPRLEAGDYKGLREINGQMVPSVPREMAAAMVRGSLDYFGIPHERWPKELLETEPKLSFPPPAALEKKDD